MKNTEKERSEVALAPRTGEIVLPRHALPRHIAIIMDGNGRWAKANGLERVAGHEEGAKTVRTITTECARLGLAGLTLYAFSVENWNRPLEEVARLMDLFKRYLISERPTIMDNNVRFSVIGETGALPADIVQEMKHTIEMSRENTGLKLTVAVNYGGRDEIVRAVRLIAEEVASGKITPEDIDHDCFKAHLYDPEMPDPDLLIRTASEMRISNFLLWQISYSELYISEVPWPEFSETDLHDAIAEYARRERRFGRITGGEEVPADG